MTNRLHRLVALPLLSLRAAAAPASSSSSSFSSSVAALSRASLLGLSSPRLAPRQHILCVRPLRHFSSPAPPSIQSALASVGITDASAVRAIEAALLSPSSLAKADVLQKLAPEQIAALAQRLYQAFHANNQIAPGITALFETAAAKGDPTGQFNYASLLLSGYGTPPDPAKAAQIFTELGRKGHGLSLYRLGELYLTGSGVKKNEKHAMNLFSLSAERAVVQAHNSLGLMYRDGVGTEADFAKAVECFKKGVQGGDPRAMVSLAHMYSHGKGVPVDHALSFQYNKDAADNYALPLAAFNTATQFFLGKGTGQDFAKAREYFTRAADGGFQYAQVNLANMCRKGLGGPRDLALAAKYYEMAAESAMLADVLKEMADSKTQ